MQTTPIDVIPGYVAPTALASTRLIGSARRWATMPWLLWLVAGVVIVALYLGLAGSEFGPLLYDALAISSAGVVVIGIRRSHVRPSGPWWILAAGIALMAVGDVTWDILALAGEVTEPSLADVAYLAGTLAICVASARYLLRSGRRLGGSLDAAIVGAALALLLWTLAVEAHIDLETMALPELATLVAYPALDVVMLGIVIVAIMVGRPIDRPGWLFGLAVVAYLASDVAYTIVAAGDAYVAGLVDVGWLLGYILWGAAALSLRSPGQAVSVGPGGTRAWKMLRPVIRIGAIVMPLAAMLHNAVRGHEGYPLAGMIVTVIIAVVAIVRLELSIHEQGRLLDERERLEESLLLQASEDPLTLLPNRRGLAKRLEAALGGDDVDTGLLVLDLDDFKAVNDMHGHQVGDQFLRAVAGRLRSALRSTDAIARYGGDEFAIVVSPCPRSDTAVSIAERILACLGEPIEAGGRQLTVSASIGIALSGLSGLSAEHLLRDADLALYEAKAAGKHRWALLDAEARRLALRSLSVVGELPRALADHEFRLAFQPIISLTDGSIESMEALLRWEHPSLGLLSAGEFLPAAERSVHMTAIGRWVLEEACTAAAEWRRAGWEVGVNVNISSAQLANDGFASCVLDRLRHAGLPPSLLTLELLETSLDAIPSVADRLAPLRAAGVRLAVDDFGTGYSSLSRVASLPITELKLDRSLVAAAENERMVSAVARMGQTLGLRLVAEGVETDAELRLVRSLGYDAAQGYLLSRPIMAPKVAAQLASWQETPAVAPLPMAAVLAAA